MTQSKIKTAQAEFSEIEDIEPSVNDVQKDFDINSPIASETFNTPSDLDDFQLKNCRTSSNLQDSQQSFEVSQANSSSDITKVSETVLESNSPASDTLTVDQGAMSKKPSALSPAKLYDCS